MFNFFGSVHKFFYSLCNNAQLDYNKLFVYSIGIFVVFLIFIIFLTSKTYEVKLIKAIDSLNSYFVENPHIDENNLVAFNNKMKSSRVPKQLRKQWQQFVLYREGKASDYMSFEQIVSNPIKNSSYRRNITILNVVSYIFAIVTFLLNSFVSAYDKINIFLENVLITPVIILLLNFIVTIFFELRHSAVVSDLNSNYPYFEVNIDKAAQTLPEYIDYEILFDRNEIKRGIPILYSYLQRRAEEEQKELENARLKNVEHEKFDFDQAGVESALVLERAMQEAENYIAERKKLMEDMEQINTEITQEEMNFRDITKEYQRQMQVSKETFENFKTQLAEANSGIEANYLKKQQQQELDRQRNLERDYDANSDRHKKILDSYHEALTSVEKDIDEAKKSLEKAMMSEFDTYSEKVYDAVKNQIGENDKKAKTSLQEKIKSLEAEIEAKDKELDDVYAQNQELVDQYNEQMEKFQEYVSEVPEDRETLQRGLHEFKPIDLSKEKVDSVVPEAELKLEKDETKDIVEPDDEDIALPIADIDEKDDEESAKAFDVFTVDDTIEKADKKVGRPKKVVTVEDRVKVGRGRPKKEKPEIKEEKKTRGRPRKEIEIVDDKKKLGRGRPRKDQADKTESVSAVKKGRGRPKKSAESVVAKISKGRGRPKKEEPVKVDKVKVGRGRPKKVVADEKPITKVGRGRPRKEEVKNPEKKVSKGRGRPRKSTDDIGDIEAYLKKIDDEIKKENDKIEKTTKELEKKSRITKRRK